MTEDKEPEDKPDNSISAWRINSNSTSGNTISYSGNAHYISNGGWNCSRCNTWVPYATGYTHACPTTYVPNIHWYYQYPTQSVERCQFCDAISHTTAEKCSRVESIEYFKDGTIKLIRFHRED